MITYFIFSNDLILANNLSNAILKSNSNAQAIGISKTLSKSSIHSCNTLLPHVIIATKSMHKKLLDKLHFNYYSIIIPQNEGLVTLPITNKVKKLTRDIKFSQKLDSNNFKKYTIAKLEKSKFNVALSGTQYLLDCIMYIYTNPYYNLNRTTMKNLYWLIAHKYSINTDIVIWNIRTAINEMCKYTTQKYRTDLYGLDYGITTLHIIKAFIISN